MEFVLTKNSLVDLDAFFYKPGFINIQRPAISLLKIDSSRQTIPLYHIGFKDNMGYLSSNQIISGVMVFEVLEGYPLQSLLFINNDKEGGNYQQSLEELDAMDFYVIQKKNQDPYGDFVLKNVKFIDTKMTQSTEEFARRMVATFVAESKIPFRIPYFFNEFKSDNYSAHILRSAEEVKQIENDLKKTWERLPTPKQVECLIKLTGKNLQTYLKASTEISIETIVDELNKAWKEHVANILYRIALKRDSPIYRLRDFIFSYYKYANAYNYLHASARGDLEFLQFINLGNEGILSKLGVDALTLNEIRNGVAPVVKTDRKIEENTDMSNFKTEINDQAKDNAGVTNSNSTLENAKEPTNIDKVTLGKQVATLKETAKEAGKVTASAYTSNQRNINAFNKVKDNVKAMLAKDNPDLTNDPKVLEKVTDEVFAKITDSNTGNGKYIPLFENTNFKKALDLSSVVPESVEYNEIMKEFESAYDAQIQANVNATLLTNPSVQGILRKYNADVIDSENNTNKLIVNDKNSMTTTQANKYQTLFAKKKDSTLEEKKSALQSLYQDYKKENPSFQSYEMFVKQVTTDKNYKTYLGGN